MTVKEIKIQLALGTLSYSDKVKLANGPCTPIEILTILSKDKNKYVRSHVAKNSNTSKGALAKLSEGKESWVKMRVAENPNTPVKVLTKLSKDKEGYVRKSVARNKNMRWYRRLRRWVVK